MENKSCVQTLLYCTSICLLLKMRCLLTQRKNSRKGRPRVEVHLGDKKRLLHSPYFNLMREVRIANQVQYFNYLRMTPSIFEELCGMVGPFIQRQDTNMRKAITVGERLALTIRMLATGESLHSLSFQFRIGVSTCSEIVDEVCEVLFQVLSPKYLKQPDQVGWKRIALEFDLMWDFPHVIGAIDGKHVRMCAPPHSGSEYYNYKGFFSIVLLAICDAHYRFTMIDVGAAGREGDAGIFATSKFENLLSNFEQGILPNLELPVPSQLPCSRRVMPYVFVGDEAFGLRENLMRPYPGRGRGTLSLIEKIFNYRLSRARRVIENAFGILVARWRIFKNEIVAAPERVKIYTKAAVVLHNMLLFKNPKEYCPNSFTDKWCPDNKQWVAGSWRASATPLEQLENFGDPRRRARTVAWDVRESFAQFFSREGSVPWQHGLVTYTGRDECLRA